MFRLYAYRESPRVVNRGFDIRSFIACVGAGGFSGMFVNLSNDLSLRTVTFSLEFIDEVESSVLV